jgi:N-sulfoglucosamine sulfohydrolase
MKFAPSLILSLALSLLPSLSAADKPNFVFILADDLSHFDAGCYAGQAHTPNLDALAGEGMRFTNCFQACGTPCSPTWKKSAT